MESECYVLILFDKAMLTLMYLRKTPMSKNRERTRVRTENLSPFIIVPYLIMVKDMLTKYNVGYTDRNIGGTILQTGPKHF